MGAANMLDDRPAVTTPRIHDLESLLDRVEQLTYTNGEVCLEDIIDVVGTRWFGPLLMVPGLVMVVPGVGDIPGVSALMGFVVLLVSVQAIFDRSTVWLPHWIASRAVSEAKVKRAIKWLRRPAVFVDNMTKRRLTWAVRHSSMYVIAATCILIAAMTPLLDRAARARRPDRAGRHRVQPRHDRHAARQVRLLVAPRTGKIFPATWKTYRHKPDYSSGNT
jgi:hypothetical protein